VFHFANAFRGKIPALVVCALIAGCFSLAFAASGTIDSVNKYAWGENIGWVNFGAAHGNVQVGDSALAGYVWSANYGWINLSPSQSGVKNDGNGNLSGSAWGQELGYINFAGVSISSTGTFTGIATGNTSGRITFNCANCKVVTSWRASSSTATSTPAATGGGVVVSSGGGGAPAPTAPAPATEPSPSAPPPLSLQQFAANIAGIAGEISKIFNAINPFQPPAAPAPEIVHIPEVAPLALQGQWDLMSPPSLGNFVLAPLPKELSLLTEQFPKLKQALNDVGVTGAASLPKLRGVELTLPGLGESVALPQPELTPGQLENGGPIVPPELTSARLGMPIGIPLAELTPQFKQGIPAEVVFTRSVDEKIDLETKLSLNGQGGLEKHISAVAGQTLRLVVKPIASASSVTGYLVLRSRTIRPGIGEEDRSVGLRSALASLVFQTPTFAQSVPPETASIEEKLALATFEYADPDHDGIYTADVQVPKVDGEYDVVTLISYKDPNLGVKQIGLTAVVDPEGYVYEKIGNNELRVSGASVSLFRQNPTTSLYELWPAKEYDQENPQVTDVQGTYAFLVPQGSYYLTVNAPSYRQYTGSPFDVTAGSEVHSNIELHPSSFWANFDWKTTIIVIIGALLVVNFYWDKRRERSIRGS
jgi:hypothetical protein